jgi:tetratricopeptide (TPR) repeat protein
METFEEAMRQARQARNEGDVSLAEQNYARAASIARSIHEPLLVAHALRHVSDTNRELGRADRALGAGLEAVAIYRADPTASRLDLANALRVTALAWQGVGKHDAAIPAWHEALILYESVSVAAGVAECEANLKP